MPGASFLSILKRICKYQKKGFNICKYKFHNICTLEYKGNTNHSYYHIFPLHSLVHLCIPNTNNLLSSQFTHHFIFIVAIAQRIEPFMYHAITRSKFPKLLQFKHIASQVIHILAEEHVLDQYLIANNTSTSTLIMQAKIASIKNYEIIYDANNYITPGFTYLDAKSIKESNKNVIKRLAAKKSHQQ